MLHFIHRICGYGSMILAAATVAHLSEEDDERSAQIGGRKNLHDAAQTIQGTHDSEHLLRNAPLLRCNGASVPLHRENIRKAEGDVCAGRQMVKRSAASTWEGLPRPKG